MSGAQAGFCFTKCPRVSAFRFCGGLFLDIKRKAPFFISDFTDAFHIQALSAILFIYLGTVTNAITFGGLLGDATENMQVGIEPCPLQSGVLIQLTSVSVRACRAYWRVFWARRSLAGSSACWPASLSPSSAAPVRFWSLNGCYSTLASASFLLSVLYRM